MSKKPQKPQNLNNPKMVKEDVVTVRDKINKKIRVQHPNKTNLPMPRKLIKERVNKPQTSKSPLPNRSLITETEEAAAHSAAETVAGKIESQVITTINLNKARDSVKDQDRTLRSKIREIIIIPGEPTMQ